MFKAICTYAVLFLFFIGTVYANDNIGQINTPVDCSDLIKSVSDFVGYARTVREVTDEKYDNLKTKYYNIKMHVNMLMTKHPNHPIVDDAIQCAIFTAESLKQFEIQRHNEVLYGTNDNLREQSSNKVDRVDNSLEKLYKYINP